MSHSTKPTVSWSIRSIWAACVKALCLRLSDALMDTDNLGNSIVPIDLISRPAPRSIRAEPKCSCPEIDVDAEMAKAG